VLIWQLTCWPSPTFWKKPRSYTDAASSSARVFKRVIAKHPCRTRHARRVLRKGEVRYTAPSKTLPTRFTFTSQYSYIAGEATDLGSAGFGLIFYQSRFYDPQLGRMTQADSIVPGGVQGLDRYGYVNNSPLVYVDPSGHESVCGQANSDPECIRPDTWDFPLKYMAQKLLEYAKSFGMTPEEVIGIGLGREMMNNSAAKDIQMVAFRNGFLRYVDENCNRKLTRSCMLNYFSSSYESVYRQFLDEDGEPASFWPTAEDYIYYQAGGWNSANNQATVQLGIDFMVGNEFTVSFMTTISAYSYDPKLALNSGVVNALALKKALGGYPTPKLGFLVVLPATCKNGAAAYSLIYNLLGEKWLDWYNITYC